MGENEPVGGEPEPAGNTDPGVSDEPTTPPSETPPELIDGKFKSVNDLLHSYREAEGKMHVTTEVNANLLRQLGQLGCTVDAKGNITVPQQQASNEDLPPDQPSAQEQFVNKLLEDPFTALGGFLQSARSIEKKAAANRRRELAKLREHPYYRKVADELEATLDEMPDHMLANPEYCTHVVKEKFQTAVGQFALSQAEKASTDPTARVAMLEGLGISEPQPTPEPDKRTVVSADDREMLARFGYTDPKDQEALIKAAKESEKRKREERNG